MQNSRKDFDCSSEKSEKCLRETLDSTTAPAKVSLLDYRTNLSQSQHQDRCTANPKEQSAEIILATRIQELEACLHEPASEEQTIRINSELKIAISELAKIYEVTDRKHAAEVLYARQQHGRKNSVIQATPMLRQTAGTTSGSVITSAPLSSSTSTVTSPTLSASPWSEIARSIQSDIPRTFSNRTNEVVSDD